MAFLLKTTIYSLCIIYNSAIKPLNLLSLKVSYYNEVLYMQNKGF